MTLTAAFKFNGATVVVQKPTVATRIRVWQFRQSISEHGAGGVAQDVADTLCYYLANTVSVDGSLGFPVPLNGATPDELHAFLKGFSEADENLLTVWDKTLYDLKYATNDVDLLPPHEVDEKKDKARK